MMTINKYIWLLILLLSACRAEFKPPHAGDLESVSEVNAYTLTNSSDTSKQNIYLSWNSTQIVGEKALREINLNYRIKGAPVWTTIDATELETAVLADVNEDSIYEVQFVSVNRTGEKYPTEVFDITTSTPFQLLSSTVAVDATTKTVTISKAATDVLDLSWDTEDVYKEGGSGSPRWNKDNSGNNFSYHATDTLLTLTLNDNQNFYVWGQKNKGTISTGFSVITVKPSKPTLKKVYSSYNAIRVIFESNLLFHENSKFVITYGSNTKEVKGVAALRDLPVNSAGEFDLLIPNVSASGSLDVKVTASNTAGVGPDSDVVKGNIQYHLKEKVIDMSQLDLTSSKTEIRDVDSGFGTFVATEFKGVHLTQDKGQTWQKISSNTSFGEVTVVRNTSGNLIVVGSLSGFTTSTGYGAIYQDQAGLWQTLSVTTGKFIQLAREGDSIVYFVPAGNSVGNLIKLDFSDFDIVSGVLPTAKTVIAAPTLSEKGSKLDRYLAVGSDGTLFLSHPIEVKVADDVLLEYLKPGASSWKQYTKKSIGGYIDGIIWGMAIGDVQKFPVFFTSKGAYGVSDGAKDVGGYQPYTKIPKPTGAGKKGFRRGTVLGDRLLAAEKFGGIHEVDISVPGTSTSTVTLLPDWPINDKNYYPDITSTEGYVMATNGGKQVDATLTIGSTWKDQNGAFVFD